MRHTSKISVILAAYHGEQYIAEQLESLFRQTRVPDEILIGDDSGDSRTYRAVEAVRSRYHGTLSYISNPARLGIVNNFANLAKRAAGDILFFCDQDDVWFPSKIEILSRALEMNPEIQVAVCESLMTDENLLPLKKSFSSPLSEILQPGSEGKIPFRHVLFQEIDFHGHNIAMKREYLDRFLQIPDCYNIHDIWILQTAALADVLYCINRELTCYRVHRNNVSLPELPQKRKSIFAKFKNSFHSSNDLELTLRMLSALSRFTRTVPNLPKENCRFLEDCRHYFIARRKLRQHRRPFRMFGLSIPLLQAYFRIGTGWRAFFRDQLF